jgi:uncharacterized repeat protein (TIGR01451 family)
MKRNIIQIVMGGILLLLMGSMVSLVSVNAQDASVPLDLPPRPTPNLNPKPGDPELPALSISVSADRTHANVGDMVEFTIILSNPGKTKVSGIKLVGLMPAIFDIVKATTTQGMVGFKAETGRVQVNNISPLGPNTNVTVKVLARVNNLAEDGAKYYTAAKVVGCDSFNSAGLFSNWLRLDIGSE